MKLRSNSGDSLVQSAQLSAQERPLQATRIRCFSRKGTLPLSFAQQQLWLIDQLGPGNVAYNIPFALRLTGLLDVEILRKSLNEIVRCHEALRTTFAVIDGQPVQVVATALTLSLPLIDLRQLPEAGREAEAQYLMQKQARQPFGLAQGPLVRATCMQLGKQEHLLLLTAHHIVFDDWSVDVFIREIMTLYQAFAAGRPSPLPELPIQYADYAVWQREWLQGETLEKQLVYWKQQINDAPAILELPTDRPRPPIQSFQGACQRFVLPQPLTSALKALSQQEGCTLFMTLLAAFNVLLHRYTGQEDILVGSPIANRTKSELEGLIGCFVNTLVIRTSLAGNPSFRELLSRVREATWGAYAHQDMPFELLVEELQPERDMSRNPLFQVVLVLQNAPMPPMKIAELTFRPFETDIRTAKFDLTLLVTETDQELVGDVEYNTDLFEAATITRLVGHFQTLLTGFIANPAGRLSDLPLLTEAERHQLLAEWNAVQIHYPQGPCLHQLFEAQVMQTPEAIALVFEDIQLTYCELNERANQLARYLVRRGVGPEVPVGLLVERSVEMLVGILGILKAGGAYVPLDPVYPPERMIYMLEDAQAPIVLTQTSLADRLSGCPAVIVCLDREGERIAAEERLDLAGGVAPENAVYVIYTSGSTGKPKGMVLTHANVARLMRATEEWYHFDGRDVWTMFHSYAFDFSVWEMWGALMYGGRLVVVPYWVSRSPQQFYTRLAEEQVTVLNQTPSAFRQLILAEEQAAEQSLSALRLVIFGGEALDLQSLRPWYERHGDERPRLVNMYGITETTVHVTYRPLGWADLENVSGSVIGGPIPDLQVYVLDAQMQLAPVGVMGELYVGGAGLGRGYLKQADLTAERFVPNPFTPPLAEGDTRGGTRLYKTGDLARYLPGGDLEYGGRIDQQVKIRGFRIELGEIEAVLRQHPAVREAVVQTRCDGHEPSEVQLVAYVVPDRKRESMADELRRFLRAKLPEYMVPSVCMMMAEGLPLTPNGKLDRQALPAPEQEESSFGTGYVPAATPIEQALAEIWTEVLGVKHIGVHDNFFALGGHSLLAAQVTVRLYQLFGCEFAVRVMFEAPTVAELAKRVEAALGVGQGEQASPIQRSLREGALPLSLAQQQLWLVDQMYPGNIAYNIPLCLRLEGRLDVAALERSLDEMVRRHEVLRTAFVVVKSQPFQAIASHQPLSLPLVDLCQWMETGREAQALYLIREEARRPFDLSHGPLVRTVLFKIEEAVYFLLVTIHHIVFDGWSAGIFWDELEALYRAFAAGEPSPLAELPIQYSDFAVWQRESLQGEGLERQLDYWRQQLNDAPMILRLPTDLPRPPIQTFRGACQPLILSQALSQRLKTLSRQEGVTLFMTLLAAFKVLLYRYTGQTDIVVGWPIANRNRPEIEQMMGYFVNTLVLRTNLEGNPTFRELLARIRQAALDAYTYSTLPFEKLVEMLRPERNAGYNPFFQVLFAFQNARVAMPRLPSVCGTKVTVEMGTAQFDLSLVMEENEQGLVGVFEYNTDLFDDASIIHMSENYRTLLERVVADSDQALSMLLPSMGAERPRPSAAAPEPQSPTVLASDAKDSIVSRKAALAARRANLPPEERALLESLL